MKLNVLIPDLKDQQNISGIKDNNLKAIEEIFSCEVSLRGDSVYVNTNDLEVAILEELFTLLNEISKLNYVINERDIIYICNALKNGKKDDLLDLYIKPLTVGKKFGGKDIMPKTLNQKRYVKNLMNKDIIFGVGPAGTGKTYLAVMYAVSLLKEGAVKKIILTRPAVEAGESLGYLPGDLKEKIAPYLRPLYDALYDALGYEQANLLIEKEVIEIAPLAYMRGRTLEGACVLLDEAQNTTTSQMKMFLTRLGFKSKMIITGDISQIDLPKGVKSGLVEAINILGDIKEIGITIFSKDDVIRHLLVAKILAKYEQL
jgi:phosphate starvation-inducible PhoH-like protein